MTGAAAAFFGRSLPRRANAKHIKGVTTTVNHDRTIRQLTLFSALIAFGVLGRWLQPDWNFTPVAAIAGFAAYYFGSTAIAMLAATAVLAISNILLPQYQNPAMMLAVFAAYSVPVLLGRWLDAKFSWPRLGALCLVPAVAFFLTTNFAHWALVKQYAMTWDGLAACYTAGLPFFRGTLAGDVFYTVGLFGAYALATRWSAMRSALAVGHAASN